METNLQAAGIRYRLLLIIFILSGFAGLIYQSIWSHYLGLFLGHAAYAQALVLALFMGGMAAGAFIAARFTVGWRNLVRAYAVVEAIIGLFGLLFHVGFVAFLGLSYDVIMPMLGDSAWINGYKWTLAGLLILPQTILLGMTFPLMSAGLIRRFPGRDGRSLGGLYFANSIGAAVGVLVAAFVLLPWIGLPGAMVVGGVLNLGVAALAWWLGQSPETRLASTDQDRSTSSDGSENGRDSSSPKSPAIDLSPRSRKRLLFVVLAATFLSSAASFAYEISFIRMLSLAVGSTLHAFELMLASFIAGIAFGALWIRRYADSTTSPMRWVGVLQILMGLAALLALVLYAFAFTWVGFLFDALAPTDNGYRLFTLGTAAIAILIMMPTAFFAGTTLPLFTMALLRAGHGERSIGRVYAWNTLGAIVGVFAAIHFLIPKTGLMFALVIAAGVDMLIGGYLLRFAATRREHGHQVRAGIAAFFLSTLLVIALVPFDPLTLSAGVYRTGRVALSPDTEVLYFRHGKTASISVIRVGDTISIATNGKTDASVRFGLDVRPTGDEPTMIVAGALPLAYQPEARTAAVIGFGSGLTTHTLLSDPALDRVDTIEIEREMVEGAKAFEYRVARAYFDPRSNIVIEDAKSYFASTQHRYDIIVSEPSNPWISGVGALFSQEFYQFVPRFLNEDGIFVQWLQLYEINEDLVGSVLNALLPHFSDVRAYLANNVDLLLVASQSPLAAQPDYEYLLQGDMARELAHVGFSRPEHLVFRRVADRDLLLAIAAEATKLRPNSDYFPVLTLEAPRARFRRQGATTFQSLTTVDFPLLEILGVRPTVGDVGDFDERGHFRADVRANIAAALATYLRDPTPQHLSALPDLQQRWLIGFQRVTDSCIEDDHLAVVDWYAENVHLLARSLLPYLSPQALSDVLVSPNWQGCHTLPESIQSALGLISAIAQRDASNMAALGRDWLGTRESRPESLQRFDTLALWALVSGHIMQRQYVDAHQAIDEFGKAMPHDFEYVEMQETVQRWLNQRSSGG